MLVGDCILLRTFTRDVSEDVSQLCEVRRMCGQFLSELEMAEEVIADMMLVLGELGSNAIRHGKSERGVIRVHMECKPDSLAISVQDWGAGMDWDRAVMEPGTPREDETADDGMRIGGWGLSLVRQLTDRLEFARCPNGEPGTTVQITKLTPIPGVF